MQSVLSVFVNERIWQNISAGDRKIMEDTMAEVGRKTLDWDKETSAKYRKDLEAKGMIFIESKDGLDLEAFRIAVLAQVNKDFPSTSSPQRLMQGMANSSVMAGKGIGSDYASRMQVVMIGAGVGVGADLEKDKTTGSDISGVGIQGGLMIGTNLGWLDTEKILGLYTDRLNIYFNYLGYDLDRKLGDGNSNNLQADLKSFGFHASYDLVKPKGNSLVRWGGVKVHTGFEYNTTKLQFTTDLNENVSETIGGQNVSGKITGKPSATIDVATQSIPVEVSTNVQLLYFLSLYTGLGVDMNFGKAKAAGALNANPSTLEVGTNGPGSGPTVQAEANISGSGNVDSFLTRAFAGVQINLPYTNIFVQADKSLGNDLIGASAGLRFVY
jgi:hypothetical protein